MSYLEQRADFAKIKKLALANLNRLAIEDPMREALIRAAVMTEGRDALAIETWPDGVATIAACGIELWRGPVAEITRRPDA